MSEMNRATFESTLLEQFPEFSKHPDALQALYLLVNEKPTAQHTQQLLDQLQSDGPWHLVLSLIKRAHSTPTAALSDISRHYGFGTSPNVHSWEEAVGSLATLMDRRLESQIEKGPISPADLTQLLSNHYYPVSPNLNESMSILAKDGKVSVPVALAIHSLFKHSESLLLAANTQSQGLTRSNYSKLIREKCGLSLTPLELDTLFTLVAPNGTLTSNDLQKILIFKEREKPKAIKEYSSSVVSIYNFVLGSIGGAVGATVVYPIGIISYCSSNRFGKNSNAKPTQNGWRIAL
jgi:hypothetical protein